MDQWPIDPWIVVAAVIALWILAEIKTSRPDGTYRKKVHPYRRMMQFIMPTRNEAVVYFDTYVRVDALHAYLAEAKPRFGADMIHALVAAFNIGLHENPRMNQFVMGYRLYQRKGRWLTFSMKRAAMDKQAKLSAVKLEMQDHETFRDLTERINGQVKTERSGDKTYADKEFDLFLALPRPIIAGFVKIFRWLDAHNLLPGAFIVGDGMYTSGFIANLGSVGMSPGFHHLYEWGTCPLFMMVGKVETRAVVEDGQIVARDTLHVRWSYDERIDDGLTARYGIDSVVAVLEDPYARLGCLADDGADARPMCPPATGA